MVHFETFYKRPKKKKTAVSARSAGKRSDVEERSGTSLRHVPAQFKHKLITEIITLQDG